VRAVGSYSFTSGFGVHTHGDGKLHEDTGKPDIIEKTFTESYPYLETLHILSSSGYSYD
jgi:hypothetical protein